MSKATITAEITRADEELAAHKTAVRDSVNEHVRAHRWSGGLREFIYRYTGLPDIGMPVPLTEMPNPDHLTEAGMQAQLEKHLGMREEWDEKVRKIVGKLAKDGYFGLESANMLLRAAGIREIITENKYLDRLRFGSVRWTSAERMEGKRDEIIGVIVKAVEAHLGDAGTDVRSTGDFELSSARTQNWDVNTDDVIYT